MFGIIVSFYDGFRDFSETDKKSGFCPEQKVCVDFYWNWTRIINIQDFKL
jgi:hypothetical protein